MILKSLVLGRLDFNEKIDIFEPAIKLTNNQVWEKNQPLIKEIRKLLNKVRIFRNYMAHCQLDMSDKAVNRALTERELGKFYFEILEYKKGEIKNEHIDFARINV